MTTPNHIGSTPIARSTGPTIGTTTNVISMKSNIKPNRKITTITTTSAVVTPPGIASKKPCICSSPPNPRNTREKIEAPIKIKKHSLVDRVDSLIASIVENSRFVAGQSELLRLSYAALLWVWHNPKLSILKLRI